ncbi:MAG: nuclear transport factor 2 family protein [Acidobacteriaceae bacterium]|nr:nuclear transport factor 2 family protein [Acidobacteriaceae bacterium]
MIRTVAQIRNELADREAIRDCVYRYARAVDRCDEDLLRTVYWPDAIDTHLDFSGTVEELIKWAIPKLRAIDNVHLITNVLIQLEGAKAAVESYYSYIAYGSRLGRAGRDSMMVGRYLDRFERRNDEWRIAARLVVIDGFREYSDSGDWSVGPFGMPDVPRGSVRPGDYSYGWLGFR